MYCFYLIQVKFEESNEDGNVIVILRFFRLLVKYVWELRNILEFGLVSILIILWKGNLYILDFVWINYILDINYVYNFFSVNK